MGRIYKILLALVIAAPLLVAGCGVNVDPNNSGITTGKTAPDFTLNTLGDGTATLSDLRGEPVVLNFWASWCGPCKGEMPYLQQVNDERAGTGLQLIAVNLGEDADTINKFLADNNLTLTVWLDEDQSVSKKYGISGIPTTFFIDKDGIIRDKVVGAFPDKATIDRYVDRLMSN